MKINEEMFMNKLIMFLKPIQIIINLSWELQCWIPEDTRRYQKIPEDTRGYQKIPEHIRRYQKIPEDTRRYQKISEDT